jgi:hypothetical protein
MLLGLVTPCRHARPRGSAAGVERPSSSAGMCSGSPSRRTSSAMRPSGVRAWRRPSDRPGHHGCVANRRDEVLRILRLGEILLRDRFPLLQPYVGVQRVASPPQHVAAVVLVTPERQHQSAPAGGRRQRWGESSIVPLGREEQRPTLLAGNQPCRSGDARCEPGNILLTSVCDDLASGGCAALVGQGPPPPPPLIQWLDAISRACLAHRDRGPGIGPCLDVDRSADQLRYARSRGVCVQADAAMLPVADGAFPTVLMAWISTDVDDFAMVVREAARVWLCRRVRIASVDQR